MIEEKLDGLTKAINNLTNALLVGMSEGGQLELALPTVPASDSKPATKKVAKPTKAVGKPTKAVAKPTKEVAKLAEELTPKMVQRLCLEVVGGDRSLKPKILAAIKEISGERTVNAADPKHLPAIKAAVEALRDGS